MVHALAAAAIAASPLFGHTLQQHKGTANPKVLSATTELNTKTLKPVKGAPKLPRSTDAVELSPDGRRVAALVGKTIYIASRATGKRLGTVQATAKRVNALAWVTADRLLAFSCTGSPGSAYPGRCLPTVQVVNPTELASSSEPEPLTDDRSQIQIARSGDREIVLISHSPDDVDISIEEEDAATDKFPTVIALNGDGEETSRIDLPDIVTAAQLDRALVAGEGREGGKVVYRFDAQAGTVQRKQYDGQFGGWLLPSPPAAALLQDRNDLTIRPLDRTTLETNGKVRSEKEAFSAAGTARGYVRRTGDDLIAYGADGKLLWKKQPCPFFNVGGIGSYVYVQCLSRKGYHYRVRVFAAKSGRQVRRVKGRFFLTGASTGRFGLAVPVMDGGSILVSVDDG